MVQVTSIQKNPSTSALEVLWTYTTESPSTPLTMADIPLASIPTMQDGESILLVDTRVPFAPIAEWVGFTVTEWSNRVPVAPRFVEPLPNSDFP